MKLNSVRQSALLAVDFFTPIVTNLRLIDAEFLSIDSSGHHTKHYKCIDIRKHLSHREKVTVGVQCGDFGNVPAVVTAYNT